MADDLNIDNQPIKNLKILIENEILRETLDILVNIWALYRNRSN